MRLLLFNIKIYLNVDQCCIECVKMKQYTKITISGVLIHGKMWANIRTQDENDEETHRREKRRREPEILQKKGSINQNKRLSNRSPIGRIANKKQYLCTSINVVNCTRLC